MNGNLFVAAYTERSDCITGFAYGGERKALESAWRAGSRGAAEEDIREIVRTVDGRLTRQLFPVYIRQSP